MKASHENISEYLRRTQLEREALAKMLHCSIADIDRALAGKPVPDSVRAQFAPFKERQERSILACGEGWDVIKKNGDEVWRLFCDPS